MITSDDFKARFPEFDLTDYTDPLVPVLNAAQEALIEVVLTGAETQSDRTIFANDAKADEAILYLAAHLLARSPAAVNARLHATRSSDKLQTGEDIYWRVYERIARAATCGFRTT